MYDYEYKKILNRLAKWRVVFAGWQLGTRPETDPECQAVRDQREAILLMRAEVSALIRLLVDKKLCTTDELTKAVAGEAFHLDHNLQQRFPGFRATDDGMEIDVEKAKQTMKGWKP